MARTKQTARKSYGGKAPRPSQPTLNEPAPTPSTAKPANVPRNPSRPARSAAPEPEPKVKLETANAGLERIVPALLNLVQPALDALASTDDRPAKRFKPDRSTAPEPQPKPEPVDDVAASIRAVKEAREAAKAAAAAAKSSGEDAQVKRE